MQQSQVMRIPLSNIIVRRNVREILNETETRELAHTMDAVGQKVPVQVYQEGSSFVLKYGHRRMAAAYLLGWDSIAAVVEPAPANEAVLLVDQYTENSQRLDMGYLDKARVYARLKELGMSQREIAQTFCLSDAEVSLALKALKADPRLQEAIELGKIKPSAVEPLLSQPPDVQAALADAAIRAKTVRAVSALVKAHKQKEEWMNMSANQEDEEEHGVNIPDDADPLEALAAQEINEALEHLRMAEATRIQHPDLVRSARPRVEELLRKAAALKYYMDGEVWDDLQDLL